MTSKCVIIEVNSSLGGLFDALTEMGVSYKAEDSIFEGNIELMCVCERENLSKLEELLAPYV